MKGSAGFSSAGSSASDASCSTGGG
jgi:hypothetical protein